MAAHDGMVSVFDDQQPVMGLPGIEFGGLRHMQNTTKNAKTTIYTGSGPRD